MDRRRASEFDQQLLDPFGQYVHGAIDRRGFLNGAAVWHGRTGLTQGQL